MTAPQHPYFINAPSPRIFAHRGFVSRELRSRGVAENSHAAFAAAQDAGAGYLETDCHLTRDGRVVLFHDADLTRVTGDRRTVAEVTHRELSEIMGDRGGLLALDDALEMFPEARFNIDVKAEAAAEPLGRIVAPHARRVLLTSFSDAYRVRALQAASMAGLAGLLPASSPGQYAIVRILFAIASGSRRAIARALEGFDALQIPERHGPVRVLTTRLLDAAHAMGLEVHVWTVNDPERMRMLVDRGVDGIITDRTDAAVAALR